MNQGNPIKEKSFDFALWIIEFTEMLGQKKFFELKSQLFRSGTSIGANVKEAQSPSSKKDFGNKMKIAMREAEETEYWLDLCRLSPILPSPDPAREFQLKEIMKLLNSILVTNRKNIKREEEEKKKNRNSKKNSDSN